MSNRFEEYNFEGYSFMVRGWETSRAWGHECYLILNGYGEVARAKCRYYNRTWEKYQYQSVMRQALEAYEKDELAHYLRNKKAELGLLAWDSDSHCEVEKPFKAGEKKKYTEEFYQTDKYAVIEKLKEHIKEGK